MSIKRYGTAQTGAGGMRLPFAGAVGADGWLDGKAAMENSETIGCNIVAQSHKARANRLMILKEADCGVDDLVRVGVRLDDPHDFWSLNKIYKAYVGAHPLSRACAQSSIVVDCKVKTDCIAYKPEESRVTGIVS